MKSFQMDGYEHQIHATSADNITIRRGKVTIKEKDVPEEKKQVDWPRLSYEPFDAAAQLKELRAMQDPNEKRIALKNIKEQIVRQQIGISDTIRKLFDVVYSEPETTDEFVNIIKDASEKYQLTREQDLLFMHAFKEYLKKHDAVQKYRKEYPNDAELFEACFGQKPTGEVTVVETPITLHFKCKEPQDYAWACHSSELIENHQMLTEKEMQIANVSVGCALPRCQIPNLAGCITLENAAATRITKLELIPRQRTLHKEAEGIFRSELRNGVDIEVKNVGVWHMKLFYWDSLGRDFLQVYDQADPEDEVLLEVPFSTKKEDWSQFILQKTLEGVTTEYGVIEASFGGAKFYDRSPQGSVIKWKTAQLKANIYSEKASKEVQVHELQHQWNKLFIPVENAMSITSLIERAIERGKSPKDIKKIVTMDILRKVRQNLIDAMARDEIIASYAGGKNSEEIYAALLTGESYQYYENIPNADHEIAQIVTNHIQAEMSEVVYGDSVHSGPFGPDDEEVRESLDAIFDVQYKRDLALWLRGVKTLEQKGYTREEILSFLAQEPAKNWLSMARRLSPKNQEEPVVQSST